MDQNPMMTYPSIYPKDESMLKQIMLARMGEKQQPKKESQGYSRALMSVLEGKTK